MIANIVVVLGCCGGVVPLSLVRSHHLVAWGVGMLWRRSTSVSRAVAPSGGLGCWDVVEA